MDQNDVVRVEEVEILCKTIGELQAEIQFLRDKIADMEVNYLANRRELRKPK